MKQTFSAILLFVLCGPAFPQDEALGKLLQSTGFPPLRPIAELLQVDAARTGADAMVVLQAEQIRWSRANQETHFVRRLMLLQGERAAEHQEFLFPLVDGWRVRRVEARTVGADGRIVDASDRGKVERTDDGESWFRIRYPGVEKHARLDLHLTLYKDSLEVAPWWVQEELPVLESRLVLIQPTFLQFRVNAVGLTNQEFRPLQARLLESGLLAHVFSMENVDPIPVEAYRPPLNDIAKQLMVSIVGVSRTELGQSFSNASVGGAPAGRSPPAVHVEAHDATWNSFARSEAERFDRWMSKKHRAAKRIALEAVGTDQLSVPQKAERVRQELCRRLRPTSLSRAFHASSPDRVLQDGAANSAELAGVASVMLRALDVKAVVAGYRPRHEGRMLYEFPVPSLHTAFLVQVPAPEGPIFFSPTCEAAVGALPLSARGAMSVPYAVDTDEPTLLDDLRAEENRAEVRTVLRVGHDGQLRGESEHRFAGLAAERWRRLVGHMDETLRSRVAQDRLLATLRDAQVTHLEVEGLEVTEGDVVLRAVWSLPPTINSSGDREVPAVLFQKIDPEIWAPVRRVTVIDLGEPFEELETTRILFDPAAWAAELPGGMANRGGRFGQFEIRFSDDETGITVVRRLKMDKYRFAARAYKGLRSWFLSNARAEAPIIRFEARPSEESRGPAPRDHGASQ